MAHPEGDGSNDLFAQLADWNLILRDTSLGQVSPAQPLSSPQTNTSEKPCERPVKGRQMYGARNGEAKKA